MNAVANASGQVLIEYILLMAVFVLLIARIAQSIPTTFAKASPYLGGKLEQRIETGQGFSTFSGSSVWKAPVAPKGGVKE